MYPFEILVFVSTRKYLKLCHPRNGISGDGVISVRATNHPMVPIAQIAMSALLAMIIIVCGWGLVLANEIIASLFDSMLVGCTIWVMCSSGSSPLDH